MTVGDATQLPIGLCLALIKPSKNFAQMHHHLLFAFEFFFRSKIQYIVCINFFPSIRIASTLNEGDKDSAAGHLLLFISALIPKALGSILTSVVIELSKPDNVRVILEGYVQNYGWFV